MAKEQLLEVFTQCVPFEGVAPKDVAKYVFGCAGSLTGGLCLD